VIFATACSAILMVSIDGTIVATALHTLTRELGTTLAWSTWTITVYQLGQIVSLPIAGRLSDSLGRRRMFLAYVAVFTVSSLLAGFATNVYLLIALRFAQALGGGGLMPSTMGVVADLFTRERDRALGLVGSFFPIGALIGPTLGGFIVTYASWRAIFFINVPVGVVVLGLLWLLLPPARAVRARIDILGAALLGAALLSVMFGLNQFGDRGVGSPLPWSLLALGGALTTAFLVHERRTDQAILPPPLLRRPAFAVVNSINVLYGAAAFAVAAVALAAFIAIEARSKQPMVDLTLLRSRVFGGGTVTMMLWAFGIFGIYFFTSIYLQDILGFSPTKAGLAFVPMALCLAAAAAVAGPVYARLGAHRTVALGMAVMAVGLYLFSVLGANATFASLMPGFVLFGAGAGLMQVPLTNSVLHGQPPERSGIASALINATREVAGLFGITVIGAILRARQGEALRHGAAPGSAFLDGYHAGLMVTVVLVAAGAVISFLALRRIQDQATEPVPVPASPAQDQPVSEGRQELAAAARR